MILSTEIIYALKLFWLHNDRTTCNIFQVAKHLVWIGASLLFASAVSYYDQFRWVSDSTQENVKSSDTLIATFIIHIIIPLVLALLILSLFNIKSDWKRSKKLCYTIGTFLAGLLMLFFCWQAYIIGPALILIGSFVHFFGAEQELNSEQI